MRSELAMILRQQKGTKQWIVTVQFGMKSVGLGWFPEFVLHKHSMPGLHSGNSYNFQGNLQCSRWKKVESQISTWSGQHLLSKLEVLMSIYARRIDIGKITKLGRRRGRTKLFKFTLDDWPPAPAPPLLLVPMPMKYVHTRPHTNDW